MEDTSAEATTEAQQEAPGADSPTVSNNGESALIAATPTDVAHAHARTDTEEPPADLRMLAIKPWQRNFIASLQKTPNIALACRAGNVSRQSAREAKERNRIFAELWEEAIQGATDAVEGSLYDVAVNGHEKIQYGKDGEIKAVEKVRDVNAMKFWLAGNRPDVYSEKSKVDVTHTHELGENLATVLTGVRLRRQPAENALPAGENVRELTAGEAKVLIINGEAQDAQSSAATKPADKS